MTEDKTLEERLAADEQRLMRDEARLTFDEARIEAEDEAIRENRIIAGTSLGLMVALAVAVTALVLSVVALRRDVDTLAGPARAGSVSSEALQDASVTAPKLAGGAVVRPVIADAAIGPQQLAADTVTSGHVAKNSLRGEDISERTLATVPSARDAGRLGSLPAGAYVTAVSSVRAVTVLNAQRTKGPLAARCPAGTRVLSGGAAIDGRTTGVSLVASAPEGDAAWTATARASDADPAWRLVVTAICAAGGR